MLDTNDFIQQILNQATMVPPALRDYSTGIIAWSMRQQHKAQFPSAVPSHYDQFIGPKGKDILGRNEAMQLHRNTPLSAIPGFTNVQRNYNISELHSGSTPLVNILDKDQFKLMERGESEFKGLKTVEDLQNFVLSTVYEQIIRAGATRAAGEVLGSVSNQILSAMDRQLSYIPGVDVFSNRTEGASSSMDWMIHGATEAIQTQFFRQKDPLTDVGTNIDTTTMQLPSSWTEGMPLIEPIAGTEDYQVPGLFSHTGKVFTSDTNMMLEKVLTIQKPGWSPVTVVPDDITRLDKLFAYTANQGQPEGLSYNAFKANPPNIATWRSHLTRSPRENVALVGRDPVPYSMEWDDDTQLMADRAEIYRDMPTSVPTGYYFEGDTLTRQPKSAVWPARQNEQLSFSATGLGYGGEYQRRHFNLAQMQIKFLLGHQSPEEEALAKDRGWDNIVNTIPLPKDDRPDDYHDPYGLERSIARRIFNTQEMITNTPGAHSYEHGEILNWEGSELDRKSEEENLGMMYNIEDANVDRASEQGFRYQPKQQAQSPTRQSMNLAMRQWRTMGPMFQWAMSGELSLGNTAARHDPSYRTGTEVGMGRLFGLLHEDFTPVTSREVNLPEQYAGKPLYWRQKDIFGIQWRNIPEEQREPGYTPLHQTTANQLLRNLGITTYWTPSDFNTRGEKQLSFNDISERAPTREWPAGRKEQYLDTTGQWRPGGESFNYYRPGIDIHTPLGPKEYDRITHRRDAEGNIIPIRDVPERGTDIAGTFAMNKRYEGSKREEVEANNTLRAIERGERTATTRWGQQATQLRALKIGDIVEFVGGPASGGKTIYARITHEATGVGWEEGKYEPGDADDIEGPESDDDYDRLDEWSKKEGWSLDYGLWSFNNRGKGTQVEFEHIEDVDSLNVLPREHEFDTTQREIKFHEQIEAVTIRRHIDQRRKSTGKPITNFRGDYSFLSNFARVNVKFEGDDYPSVEHAFAAAKTTDPEIRKKIRDIRSPGEAKKFGKTVKLRPDWETVKVGIMRSLIRNKFSHEDMADELMMTGGRELIEENTWGDKFWGVSKGEGENQLGELLMDIRDEKLNEQHPSRPGTEFYTEKYLKNARIGPPSRAYTDMLRDRYTWWEDGQQYVPLFQYLDEKPVAREEIFAPARKWEIEDQARRNTISEISARQLDTVGSAMVDASNRSKHWTSLLGSYGKEIRDAIYSSGMSLLKIMQTPPVPEDAPPIEGMSDIVQSSIPQDKRSNQFDLGAVVAKGAIKVYADWLEKAGGVEPDEATRRATQAITTGHEFKARNLKVQRGNIPADALSEKEAFSGTSALGIAIGNYGYLRGKFMSQGQLEKKYSGRELLQKSYLEGQAAGFHEIGHIVYSKLDPTLASTWSVFVIDVLDKLGWEKMLASDVPGAFADENISVGIKEEFAQAYAIATTQGSAALRAYYPEYADFFEDHKDIIEDAGKDVSLIRFKDKSSTREFKAKQLEVHGELPMIGQPMGPGGFLRPMPTTGPGGTSPFGFGQASLTGSSNPQQIHSAQVTMGAQQFAQQQAAATASALQNQAQYHAFTASQGQYHLDKMIRLGGLAAPEITKATQRAAPVGATISMTGGLIDVSTGQIMPGGEKDDIGNAISQGKMAVEMAIGQGQTPAGGREWAATLITRANAFIESYYENAFKQAPIGTAKTISSTMKRIAGNVAEETILQSVFDAKDYPSRGDVKGLHHGARIQPITTAKQWIDVAMGDPEIKRRMESGEITEDMMTGPPQVFEC